MTQVAVCFSFAAACDDIDYLVFDGYGESNPIIRGIDPSTFDSCLQSCTDTPGCISVVYWPDDKRCNLQDHDQWIGDLYPADAKYGENCTGML